ncbi:MAG: M23 family metallopeptidase, partial [Verrucomicrobia bacterium]|nr:M23 family metallopeptidase [Verrucomicrobiota bacterium]
LPTANRNLYVPGAEEKFFAGTAGKPWTSGTFGCVRSDGQQMHEGIDIRCLQRDARGEPIDPVMATADGVVAYVNTRPSLSNYGNYIVVRHQVEGLEIDSLYAHLSRVREGLRAGQPVRQGEVIATMGRTANTREIISKDRAHVHFELNVFYNDYFPRWYKTAFPGERNDHGLWNGQNLMGLDPRRILLAERQQGPAFSLLDFIRHEACLCRVRIRATSFPFLKRYPALVEPNPAAARDGIAGYQIDLDYNGVPLRLVPQSAAQLKGRARFQLLWVNAAEERKNPARHFVAQRGGRWELTSHGLNLLDLLTYNPAGRP